MSSADRKLTFRYTRRHEQILSLLKHINGLNTTKMCNKIVSTVLQNLVNEAKEACDIGRDYDTIFAEKATIMINQLTTQKREILSFRLTKENQEFVQNHFKFYNESGEIKHVSTSDLTRVVSSMIYYYLDRQNVEKLCEIVGVPTDEIYYWMTR